MSCKRESNAYEQYVERYKRNRAIRNGCIWLAILLLTSIMSSVVSWRDIDQVRKYAEPALVVACEKEIRFESCFIKGECPNDRQKWFEVSKEIYDSTELGESFRVYQYMRNYESTMDELVEHNSGFRSMLWKIASFIAFCAMIYYFVPVMTTQRVRRRT